METFHKIVEEARNHVDTLIIHGAKLTADEKQERMRQYVNKKLETLP